MTSHLEYNGRKIITDFDPKPIPNRRFDWTATFEGYDGSEDSNEPIGRGATEKEAVGDLIEQVETAEPQDWQVHPEGDGTYWVGTEHEFIAGELTFENACLLAASREMREALQAAVPVLEAVGKENHKDQASFDAYLKAVSAIAASTTKDCIDAEPLDGLDKAMSGGTKQPVECADDIERVAQALYKNNPATRNGKPMSWEDCIGTFPERIYECREDAETAIAAIPKRASGCRAPDVAGYTVGSKVWARLQVALSLDCGDDGLPTTPTGERIRKLLAEVEVAHAVPTNQIEDEAPHV